MSLTMVFEKGERTIEKENEIRYALGKYLLDLDLADGTNKHRASSVPSACFEIKVRKRNHRADRRRIRAWNRNEPVRCGRHGERRKEMAGNSRILF